MNKEKPLASLSLDLDDQWSYMKVHGDEGWDRYPSYLDIVVPFVLDLLDELGIKITFFIVGQDAAIKKNQKILKSIVERGHEIGNHSFHHESWLKTYSKEKIEEEIIRAENAIFEATGQRPICFRGPGFSWSNDLLETLQKRSYHFDASILPTYISPLMRMYYFWNSKLTKAERESRKELFGSYKEGFYSVKPFRWKLNNNRELLEIPVTTMPFFKIPFHLSYLLYISGYSRWLMKAYLEFTILLCKISKTPPSVLLHPLDLISGDRVPQLSFFPGMDIPTEKKVKVFNYVLKRLQKDFNILPMVSFSEIYTRRKRKIKTVTIK
jgi:peptidoglycan/xylan/chitin deacetylase (PgdA/CDA1 family)